MPRFTSESLLKGVFLGLLLYAALKQPGIAGAGQVAGWMLVGLLFGLIGAAMGRLGEVRRAGGNLPAFVVLLLLESPGFVYAGLLLGLVVGAFTSPATYTSPSLLWACVGGGAVGGFLMGLLRGVRHRQLRIGLGLLFGAAVVAAAVWGLDPERSPEFASREARQALGVQILFGLPFFYLLTFAGRAEESEAEVVAMCAALGVGVTLLNLTPNLPALGLVLPAAVYWVYATKVLDGLRVFKHTLRGFNYLKLGRTPDALLAFRRAVQLDPTNRLARRGLWDAHRAVDLDDVARNPDLLPLLDLDLCLDRAAQLLSSAPTADQLVEARRLLDLVGSQRPASQAEVDFWRAVADTHAKHYDAAASRLAQILDPAVWQVNDAARRAVLVRAWDLALTRPRPLVERLGPAQLALPGRRMDSIAAIERQLNESPGNPTAKALKPQLYADLTEGEYLEVARNGAAADFDHDFILEVGRTFLAEPERWRKGFEFIRLAARGVPEQTPSAFLAVAAAAEQAGDRDTVREAYQQAKRFGLEVGVSSLTDAERTAFYEAVRNLAEDAAARGDIDSAISDYLTYSKSEKSGIETCRKLAELYQDKGDLLAAINAVEQGLCFNKADADLVERKARLHRSVSPEQVRQASEAARAVIDTGYCVKTARQVLSNKDADLELIEWASELAEVALAARPDSLTARLVAGRTRLRRGERDKGLELIEDVRCGKPEKFKTTEDEDAWYESCRILGRMYLEELGRPDLAVSCLQDFLKSQKSGADSHYLLGRAYEELGNFAQAKRHYKQVVAFENHPLYWDARNALERLDRQSHSPG